MAKTRPAPAPSGNRLLTRLPPDVYERLLRHLQPVSLDFKLVLYEARSPIVHVYFPNRGCVSALARMEDGTAIEVATIGNEGTVGLSVLFGAETSPNEVVVQVEGDGFQMDAETLKREAGKEGPLRRLLLQYHTAFMTQVSQSVACNGLHNIQQRCCRWLLMTRDRVESDVIALTHEYLGIMLGVRRSSVTDVLSSLKLRKWIDYNRGKITLHDRKGLEAAACECYRVLNAEYDRLLR